MPPATAESFVEATALMTASNCSLVDDVEEGVVREKPGTFSCALPISSPSFIGLRASRWTMVSRSALFVASGSGGDMVDCLLFAAAAAARRLFEELEFEFEFEEEPPVAVEAELVVNLLPNRGIEVRRCDEGIEGDFLLYIEAGAAVDEDKEEEEAAEDVVAGAKLEDEEKVALAHDALLLLLNSALLPPLKFGLFGSDLELPGKVPPPPAGLFTFTFRPTFGSPC